MRIIRLHAHLALIHHVIAQLYPLCLIFVVPQYQLLLDHLLIEPLDSHFRYLLRLYQLHIHDYLPLYQTAPHVSVIVSMPRSPMPLIVWQLAVVSLNLLNTLIFIIPLSLHVPVHVHKTSKL
jgi:hypothetical protein